MLSLVILQMLRNIQLSSWISPTLSQCKGPTCNEGRLHRTIRRTRGGEIRRSARSVRGADWKVRVGHHGQQKFPLVLGRDFSGVVSAVGEGVADLRIGDEVFGVLEPGREAAYAEKIAIGASIVAKKPSGMSHVDAAALALTGLIAVCSMEIAL